MKILCAETEIRAEASEVWRHITDLSSYPDWNRLVQPTGGELREGGILFLEVADEGRRARAQVTRLVPERELTLEVLQPLRLLRSVLTQRLQPLGEGWVRYVCIEEFGGLLAPFMAAGLERTLGPRCEETCDALRGRVARERLNGAT